MANEINYTISIQVAKSGIGLSGSVSLAKDMSGSEMSGQTQSLTTSQSALSVGSCDQLQSVFIQNMSSTESVKVCLDSGLTQRLSTIKPLGGILLEQPPTALYVATVANTADIWVLACED
jgi:hypothetical protein